MKIRNAAAQPATGATKDPWNQEPENLEPVLWFLVLVGRGGGEPRQALVARSSRLQAALHEAHRVQGCPRQRRQLEGTDELEQAAPVLGARVILHPRQSEVGGEGALFAAKAHRFQGPVNPACQVGQRLDLSLQSHPYDAQAAGATEGTQPP